MAKTSNGHPFLWSEWLQTTVASFGARGDDAALKRHPTTLGGAAKADQARADGVLAAGEGEFSGGELGERGATTPGRWMPASGITAPGSSTEASGGSRDALGWDPMGPCAMPPLEAAPDLGSGGLSPLEPPWAPEADVAPDLNDAHGHDQEHEHNGDEVLCSALPREDAAMVGEGAVAGGVGITAGAALVAFGDTFRLSSNPTASKTIYLDFDGHTTTGTSWNNSTMGATFTSPAYNTDGNAALFSNTELTLIQRAWQRIAADFSPFDVNVTTMAPPDDWLIKTNSVDPNYGIRVVMTSYGPSSSSAGGIAYIDSFNWGSDTPCFVYNTSLIGVTEAVSHEVGHTLGLSHDGTALGGAAYYSGHGSGENGWASIMGVGYYQSVTQWDDGTFYDSNNGGTGANYNKGPDDLAIITSYNGFGYLPDQEGNNQSTANALAIQAGSVRQYGTIETRGDLDWYQFTLASSGSINLSFNPYWFRTFIDTDGLWGGPVNPYYAPVSDANTGTAWADNGANLDLAVELYNSANVLLASANPAGLAASLNVADLAADTYYLKLDGVGFGTPTVSPPTGYSDYASIGSYLISGTITGIDPLPEISLALGPDFSVAEDGTTNLVWTFSRTGDTSAALTVNVTLGGTATNGSDYILGGWTAGTVTFDAGQATTVVSADPTADTTQESDETVSLQLAAGTGYGLATTIPVTGTISNDDMPSVTLSVSPVTVTEDGAPNLIYTFSRSYATADPLVVSYTVGGTAQIGVDYTGPSTTGVVKTITIAANATSTTLTVNPTTDTLFEADETVALTLFPGFGYRIGTTTAVVGTITNDDLARITLTLTPISVAENGGAALVYTFTREGLNTSALTVNYTVGGTATNGVDYTNLPGSVTFAAGISTTTVSVVPIDETLVEADETVSLTLSPSPNYAIGTSGAVSGTITNDDLPVISLAVSPASAPEAGLDAFAYTFSRSGPTTGVLTVNYTIGGTASNGIDYTAIGSSVTFASGSSTATVTIDPLSDTLVEDNETVLLTLASGIGYVVGTSTAVVGTILNSEPQVITLAVSPSTVRENGSDGGLLYTFSRSGALADALIVNYGVGGTATAGLDYSGTGSSVTFAAGDTTATMLVTPLADTLSEADETVELTLAGASNYTVGTDGAVVGILTNVDLPLISLRMDPLSIAEDAGIPLRFTFRRDYATTSPLSVAYTVAGSATAGTDYGPLSGTITIAANAYEAVLEVLPTADTDVEADETVALSLTADPSVYRIASTAPVVGTILNDDRPRITLSLNPQAVDEDGSGTLVYRFERTGPTDTALTVNVAIGGTATSGIDYSGGSSSVSFDIGQSVTTLTIDPIADAEIEPDETVTMTLVADAAYGVGTVAPVEGTILNDDWPVISLLAPGAAVAEDSGNPLVWTFKRTGPLDGGLTVGIAVAGTAIGGSDYAPIGGSIAFAPGQDTATLSITPLADSTIEADESIDLSLVAGAGYTVGTPEVARGTILNDDLPTVTLALAPNAVTENSGTALVYTFTRSGPTGTALTVNYGVDGTATLGSDYGGIAVAGTVKTVTFAVGSSTATINVTPIADPTVEANETVALTLQSGGGYRVGTANPVTGTILNDDYPGVTLTLAPSTVTEGGTTNLTYTFTRSVATADPLTVAYSIAGTATPGVDYTGIAAGSGNRTITIAGGAASAQVIVDPTDDSAVESHETVILTLQAGSNYTVSTSTGVTGTINNDDSNPPPTARADTLIFTPSQDNLTGLGGADIFQLIDLKNSLFVSSTTVDKVTTLVPTEDRFDSPFRTTAINPTAAGSVKTLDSAGISTLLNNARFAANGAATFTFGNGTSQRTFLGINDGVAGYQANNDAIIEITGYTPTTSLGSLQVF